MSPPITGYIAQAWSTRNKFKLTGNVPFFLFQCHVAPGLFHEDIWGKDAVLFLSSLTLQKIILDYSTAQEFSG